VRPTEHPVWVYRMPLTINVISNLDQLLESQDAWDELVSDCATSPFFFTGFMREMMELRRWNGWSPLLIWLSRDGVAMAIAPLVMKRTRLGMRYVRFLLEPYYSSDLVLRDSYREVCIRQIVDFVFETLHCTILDLTLPAESSNVQILQTVCNKSGIFLYKRSVPGQNGRHTILQAKGTWDEFRATRGRNFRKYFKGLERRLDQAGSWRIIRVSCDGRDPSAIERICSVERMSWKNASGKGSANEDLSMTLRGSSRTAASEPNFKPWACFLELNGVTLAYCLVLEYKAIAVLSNTSFDERLRGLYPGTYVVNESIRQLFNEGRVKTIDFATDIPFHRRWSSTCLSRVRVTMCRGKVLPVILGFLVKNPRISDFLSRFPLPIL
jgi:hypothetical protein